MDNESEKMSEVGFVTSKECEIVDNGRSLKYLIIKTFDTSQKEQIKKEIVEKCKPQQGKEFE